MHHIMAPSSQICSNIFAVTTSVSINLLSAREGIYTVTCTTTGGTVLSGSLTGPGRVNIINFSSVGTRNYRGQDSYRASIGTRTGGGDGDTYQCTATNGVPSPDGSGSTTLRGTCQTHTHAHTRAHRHTRTHKNTHTYKHAHMYYRCHAYLTEKEYICSISVATAVFPFLSLYSSLQLPVPPEWCLLSRWLLVALFQ